MAGTIVEGIKSGPTKFDVCKVPSLISLNANSLSHKSGLSSRICWLFSPQ